MLHTEIWLVVARIAALVFLPVEFEILEVSFVGEAVGHFLSEFFQQPLRFHVQLGGGRRRRTVFVWNDVEVHLRLRVGQVVAQAVDGSHEAEAGCVAR